MSLEFFFEFWCEFFSKLRIDNFLAGFDEFGFGFVFAGFFVDDTGAACEDDFIDLEI